MNDWHVWGISLIFGFVWMFMLYNLCGMIIFCITHDGIIGGNPWGLGKTKQVTISDLGNHHPPTIFSKFDHDLTS